MKNIIFFQFQWKENTTATGIIIDKASGKEELPTVVTETEAMVEAVATLNAPIEASTFIILYMLWQNVN